VDTPITPRAVFPREAQDEQSDNSYGVDLNRTAVELAEVSLWLNVMHQGLQAVPCQNCSHRA
jgi:hypothetical protein